MKKIAVYMIVVFLLAAGFTLSSSAFDGNDYGGGDYGGGDYGGGGYDGGDYDGGSWDWSDSDGGGSGEGGGGFILVLVIAGIFIFIESNKNKTSRRTTAKSGGVRHSSDSGLHIELPNRTAEIESILKNYDPDFSASDFVSFAKNVYIDIQMAWCKRDLSPVRFLLHDNLYNTTVKQIQAKIDQGVIYHYESMVVNTAYLTSLVRDNQYEYLTIYLNARMIDWQEDEKTGYVLRGDKTTRWDLRYKMTFMRSAGQMTKAATAGPAAYNCPNCGAPVELSSSTECPYCHSTVTTGQYSWVLADFGTIRDDTVDEGIRLQ